MRMAPLDYGPVLLRKPFGSRLAADTLPSGCPCGQSATVGASPWLYPSFPTACPHRVRHGRVPQPTRHYPRLWIHRPSSGRLRDSNPPDQNAAQHTLRTCPPPQAARPVPRGSPVGISLPAAGASRVAAASHVLTPEGWWLMARGGCRPWDGVPQGMNLRPCRGGLLIQGPYSYQGRSAPWLWTSAPPEQIRA